LSPTVQLLPFDQLDEAHRQQVTNRLMDWMTRSIATHFRVILQDDAQASGFLRGISYQLKEGIGSITRKAVKGLVTDLSPPDRKMLRKQGIVIGRHFIYAPKLLKKEAIRIRAILWIIFHKPAITPDIPEGNLVSFAAQEGMPAAFYERTGYKYVLSRCIRIDALERVAEAAWTKTKKGGTPVDGSLASLVGCDLKGTAEILMHLGYHTYQDDTIWHFRRKKRTSPLKKQQRKTRQRPSTASDDSPFAHLKTLLK